jgi:predicted nucleic acid-binding protein
MLLIDTSVWIVVFRVGAACRRHRNGQIRQQNNLLLIHNDRDFETIAQVRSLQQLRFQP